MVRYFCSTCNREVSSLSDLVDLTSKLSSGNRPEWTGLQAGFEQVQVCKRCVSAIKQFISGLSVREAPERPEETSATVQ